MYASLKWNKSNSKKLLNARGETHKHDIYQITINKIRFKCQKNMPRNFADVSKIAFSGLDAIEFLLAP